MLFGPVPSGSLYNLCVQVIMKLTNRQKEKLEGYWDRGTKILFVAAAFMAMIVYILHIVTHFPFFDGTVHVRYLWMISSGLRANVDFFCIYPTLGYFLTLPFFRLFPESAFVVLALRLFSALMIALVGVVYYYHGKKIINDWKIALLPFLLICTDRSIGVFFSEYSTDHIAALIALWAMTMFVQEESRFVRIALCSMLSLLSLFIMPKYYLPLISGWIGYATACYLKTRKAWPVIAGALSGGGAALLLVVLVLTANNDSIANNIKYSFLFNYRFTSVLEEHVGNSPLYASVLSYLLSFFRYHPVLSFSFILGYLGWFRHAVKDRVTLDHVTLGGGGILLGCVLSTLSNAVYCEQYIAPFILCSALFVPFAFSEIVSTAGTRRIIRSALVVAAFSIIAVRLDHVADEFDFTPYNSRGDTQTSRKLLGKIAMAPTGINILNEYDDLLDIIPRNERVVAAWPFHPLFRRDLTFQVFDDRPSLSFGFDKDDPVMKTFSPEYFKQALEQSPPALIALNNLGEHYPPGWDAVAAEFIERHADLYEKYSTKLYEGYIRKDLLATE